MLFGKPSTAQLTDTIEYSLGQKPKYFITLASFNTFIDHQYANFFRIKMGLSYNQRIRFGLSYSKLANNDVGTDSIHVAGDNFDYYTNGTLNFSFVSLSAEYFFFNDYPWQFTITPFQLGYGKANYQYYNHDRQLSFTTKELFLMYHPEISAQYTIFKWLGAGATAGYRFTMFRSANIVHHINAPTFSLDLRLFVDEIYKMIFREDERK